jgi:ergothioneine biosynthesis protein EgtB
VRVDAPAGAATESREALARRYLAVRAHTEALAAPLSPEDQVVQSMPDVSPTKWHRAHTTWFFETFLCLPSLPGYHAFDPAYGFLFNSYYEAVGPRYPRSQRGLISRPGVAEVAAYRAHVDAAMEELFAKSSDADWPDLAPLVELGAQHEQQHQELLLMDVKHVLSCNPTDPAYGTEPATPHPPGASRWLDCDGGVVTVGHAGGGFAFDNESPAHDVLLQPYRVADRLVTNNEWIEFVADDGYRRPELWLSDGWYTVQAQGWHAPLYWRTEGTTWTEFTLSGRVPLDPDAPVRHVSHYEADAYARWRGARLSTEAEWEHAARTHGTALHQRDGVAWQWTASAYLPYPRFAPAPGAVGEYNGKFMSGQMVLRGSASITPTGHARATYRNFFPPQCRWMYSAVRLATDA